MGQPTDLDLVAVGLRYGIVSPDELARLAHLWTPATDPPFIDFLTARTAVSTNRLQELAARAFSPTPSADPAPPSETAALRPPPSNLTPTPGGATTVDHPAGRRAVADGLPPPPPGGRYQPLRLHQAGGLGAVWVARDAVVGRDVALKTIRPDRPATPAQVARFVQEARVTGRLEHPCIVPLYDLITPGAGGAEPCYVMRLVSGRTLAKAAADYHRDRAAGPGGPLDLAGLLDAVVAVCRAVAFAHAHGVLHRDLKGQNVILGEFGEVFLLDWGLAKEVGGAADPDDRAAGAGPAVETLPGSVVGTPAFLSPEVAGGAAATAASDVYGLGAILYQVLTGSAPYKGVDAHEVVRRVRTTDPAPVAAATPAALVAVCRKAMARNPADRYATADALATDVRRFLADEPVTAYREPFPARAGRWARRHRTAVAVAAACLVTAVAGLGVTTGLVWREERRTADALGRAEGEWRRAEANLDAAHRLSTGVIEVTERVLPPVRGSELARRDLTRAAVEMFRVFAGQRPDNPDTRRWAARLGVYDANLRRLLGDAAGADAAYRDAIDRLRAGPAAGADLAAALRDRARLLATLGRAAEADAAFDEADALVAGLRADRPDAPGPARLAATLRIDRADLDRTRGRYAEAAAAVDAAHDLLARLPAAGADGAHPYDPLLRAFALTAKVVAERERAGYAAAQPPLKDARDQLRTLAADRRPGLNNDDVLFAQAVCEFEASRTWLRSEKDFRANAEKNLTGVITRFDDLATRHPAIPEYRGWAARARVVRGGVRATLGRATDARDDFEAGRTAAAALAAAHPGYPDYLATLGRAELGLMRLAGGDEAEVNRLRARAVETLRAAAAAAPHDVEIAAALADAQARR